MQKFVKYGFINEYTKELLGVATCDLCSITLYFFWLVMIVYQNTKTFSTIKNRMILIKPFRHNKKTSVRIRLYRFY